MRKPSLLMIHTLDHYAATFTKEAGASKRTLPTTPTNESVPCNWQEADSSVVQLYQQRRINLAACAFLVSKTIWEAIGIGDRVVRSGNYRVAGKQNIFDRVYRLDLEIE